MTNCYVWRGTTPDGSRTDTYQACATNPGWIASQPYLGSSYFQPADNGVAIINEYAWISNAVSITLVTSEAARQAAISGTNFGGGTCAGCLTNAPPESKYDCINGQCLNASTYKTPGFYKSKSDCEIVCGKEGKCLLPNLCVDPTSFCPPGKVCISNSEWNQIESLANQLKERNCL